MSKKYHQWTDDDDKKLKTAIEECEILFEHYKNQSGSYNDGNVWDAIAGRLVPDLCVTGAACRRRWEVLNQRKNDAWEKTSEMVRTNEHDLAETTFDGVSEILGNVDALFDKFVELEKKIDKLLGIWEA